MAKDNKIRVRLDQGVMILNVQYPCGTVMGERLKDGTLKPSVEGVTAGHLQARLRRGELIEGPLPQEAGAKPQAAEASADKDKQDGGAEAPPAGGKGGK